MLFRIITWLIVIGIIYRILSRFIFPIFHITSATSSRLREMQDQMKEMDKKINQNAQQKRSKKDGDYIDYEEVR